MKGHWKFCGVGVMEVKLFVGKYEAYHIAGLEFCNNILFLHGLPTQHHLCQVSLQTLLCDLHFLVVLSETINIFVPVFLNIVIIN